VYKRQPLVTVGSEALWSDFFLFVTLWSEIVQRQYDSQTPTQDAQMSLSGEQSFFRIATDRSVVLRATKIALVVGCVLAVINHGDRIVSFSVDFETFVKILLTFFVPYSVSTYSSVGAVRERMQRLGDKET